MNEKHIGFLCNIASTLSANNETHKLLRSYYLMRCTQVTKGYGLPAKYFSRKARCPHCCLEWTSDTEVKAKPIKLSKRQRQRKWSRKKTESKKGNFEKNRTNEMEQVCTFCKQSTTTKLTKPEQEYMKLKHSNEENNIKDDKQKKQIVNKAQKKADTAKTELTRTKTELTRTKTECNKNAAFNVYSNAFDVFSLKNKKNTLSGAIKEPCKVIKNSKKRKDKFAGLCQKAVLASAKLKERTEAEKPQTPQDKLNLFLKPSSG